MMSFRRLKANEPDFSQLESMGEELLYYVYEPFDADDIAARTAEVNAICEYQLENGGFPFLDSYEVEHDARFDFCHWPTYMMTAKLMRLFLCCPEAFSDEAMGCLVKAADEACCFVPFAIGDYSYEDHSRHQNMVLNVLLDSGLARFLHIMDDLCQHLADMCEHVIREKERSRHDDNILDKNIVRRYRHADEEDIRFLDKSDLVWYVCYGSNLSLCRFTEYINRCDNKMLPLMCRPITIPYELYFGGYSHRWEGPTAFLDVSTPGETGGKGYLVTREQFEQIMRMEGANYSRKVPLGEIDGIECLTFTTPLERIDNESNGQPCEVYLELMRKGQYEFFLP